MVARLRLLALALTVALVTVGFTVTSAEAAVAKVTGLKSTSQNHYNATFTIRWKPIRGATYQARWASSKGGLARAAVRPAGSASATSPALNRCSTSWVQVRAVKGAKVGKWSSAKGVRFKNPWAAKPSVRGSGISNGIKLTWPTSSYATRYRVRWNAAPFGNFPGGDAVVGGGWLSQATRTTSLKISTTPRAGDKMMGVAYANPVYVRLDANNACNKGIRSSAWTPVFPTAPDPGPGDGFRMGSYNVELSPSASQPTRIAGLAKNINDHDLDVISLQEASGDTVSALKAKLPTSWRAAPSIRLSGQQIMYDQNKFRLKASGSFLVPNPQPGKDDLITPWARLEQVHPSGGATSQDVFVVAIHLAENADASKMNKKRDAGNAARVAMRAIDAINPNDVPVIVAGDLRYHREPFGDVAGYVEAPPTFVRGGYYDSLAAVKKTNYQYSSVNGHKTQSPEAYGVATRPDYMMLKGFDGSRAYVNVANWKYNGSFVSDHNLIYADLTIPYR
ncbi:hypothetical protein ABIE44_003102 [Marmoricola sp. OAE513]|uniref:endonuclease/exonuclease/phosphatase family protein n=1 Tax=Marmoricola sp. OAE513 TaxID=2817894 RepID=UPI001AE98AA9